MIVPRLTEILQLFLNPYITCLARNSLLTYYYKNCIELRRAVFNVVYKKKWCMGHSPHKIQHATQYLKVKQDHSYVWCSNPRKLRRMVNDCWRFFPDPKNCPRTNTATLGLVKKIGIKSLWDTLCKVNGNVSVIMAYDFARIAFASAENYENVRSEYPEEAVKYFSTNLV